MNSLRMTTYSLLLVVCTLAGNQLSGGLEPLRSCAELKELFLAKNHLTGPLEPLQSCKALQELMLDDNKLSGGIEHLKRLDMRAT